jgi:hypothetical protein
MNPDESRYYTWRSAIVRPIWVLDRHWYTMLGQLYQGSKPKQDSRVLIWDSLHVAGG